MQLRSKKWIKMSIYQGNNCDPFYFLPGCVTISITHVFYYFFNVSFTRDKLNITILVLLFFLNYVVK